MRKNPRKKIDVKPLKREWRKGRGLEYKPLRDYSKVKKGEYRSGQRALVDYRTRQFQWVGCVINPKMMRPYFVGQSSADGGFVVYVPTTDLENVEVVGAGYFDTSEGGWGAPADYSGYPRIHTPSGVAETQIGLGTVLYTGGCLVGSNMILNDSIVTVHAEVDGASYSLDAEGVIASGWRRALSEDLDDYDLDELKEAFAEKYGLDPESVEITDIESKASELPSEHLENQGCCSALGPYNPGGSPSAQAWWSGARDRGLVTEVGEIDSEEEREPDSRRDEISVSTTMTVDFENWFDSDEEITEAMLGAFTDYFSESELNYDAEHYGFSEIYEIHRGSVDNWSGSGDTSVSGEVMVYAKTHDGELVNATMTFEGLGVDWDADEIFADSVKQAFVEAVWNEFTPRQNPYLRKASGEPITQMDMFTNRETKVFRPLSELSREDILPLHASDFTPEEMKEFSAPTDYLPPMNLESGSVGYFDRGRLVPTELYRAWRDDKPHSWERDVQRYEAALRERNYRRDQEAAVPALLRFIAGENEIPVESLDPASVDLDGEDWGLGDLTFDDYGADIEVEGYLDVSGTAARDPYDDGYYEQATVVVYPIENAIRGRLVFDFNEVLSADHGSPDGQAMLERVLNLDLAEVQDPEIFRFFFGLVEHLGATQSQMRFFINRTTLRSDLPRDIGEQDYLYDPDLGFVPGLREAGIRANPEELDFQAIGRELYGDLADLD